MNRPAMQCHYCQGNMKTDKVTYTVNRHGYHLLIDDVEAWVCQQCNEPYFETETVEAIQEGAISLKNNIARLA